MPHYNSKTIIEAILTEPIHLQNAIKILSNWDKIVQTLSIERQDKINNPNNGLDPIKAIRRIVKDSMTSIRTSYKYSIKLSKSGRLYPINGILQNMCRELRALLQYNQTDVDIVNCHPVLLSQICSKHSIECPKLLDYIANRNQHIERIVNDMRSDAETVKKAFLTVLNGGRRAGFTDRFFIEFKNEINEIHIKLKDFYPDKYKVIKSKKDFNELGSLMNVLLCEHENEILIHSYNYMTDNGFTITTFVFDGFMVDNDKILTDDDLAKLSDYIKDKTNFKIEYKIKPFDTTIDLSIYNDNIDDEDNMSVDIKDLKSYQEMKKEFELTHAKIILPPAIITELNGEVYFQSFRAANESYLDLKYLTKDKKGNFIDKQFFYDWMRDSKLRKYEKIVFKPPPLKTTSKMYNTWTDFEIKDVELIKTDRDYWAEYRLYVKNLFQNEEVENFFLARYAYKLQNPAYRTYVCLIVSGRPGDGKNRLFEPIYRIFGSRYTQVLDKGKKIYEKHSQYEKEVLLLRVDEAGGLCNFENSESLKTRITENTISIEPKGIDAYDIDLYADYDMTTNNRNVVKIDDEDRGRFLEVETTSYYKNNVEFFSDYSKNIVDNKQALRQIYEGLINFDVSLVVPSGNFQYDKPHTAIEAEVKAINRDNMFYFIDWLSNEVRNKNWVRIEADKLWLRYKEWCADYNFKQETNIKTFGAKFSLISKKINETHMNAITKDSHNVRTIDCMKLRSYFNELNTCGFIED